MSLGTLIAVFVIVGLALFLINRFVPMDGNIKTLMNWAVIIILILWLLDLLFGLGFGTLNTIRVGR